MTPFLLTNTAPAGSQEQAPLATWHSGRAVAFAPLKLSVDAAGGSEPVFAARHRKLGLRSSAALPEIARADLRVRRDFRPCKSNQ
jgi:hypothetical protein